ncbi:MAG: ABC transporter ATP-binding protein [Planctomycetota bacterium]
MPVLEVEGLCKSFRSHWTFRSRPVVQDLNLQVEQGEVFGFLGPNGAGKTTTLKLLLGLVSPDKGRIRLFGQSQRDHRVRARLGYLPENPFFYEYLTGREFLDFYARFFELSAAERRKRVAELLERSGISAAADLPLRKYSKGMVQRLGLAQALIGNPDLVLLDEPMSGLDPLGRRDARDLILELRGKGCTVFFSSHILQDAEMICDRVAILVQGKLRRMGSLKELVGEHIQAWEVTAAGDKPGWPGEVLSRRGDEILRRVTSEADLQRLLAEVGRSGVRLVSLVPQRETLEQVFLRQVRGTPAEEPRSVAAAGGKQ